MRRIFVLLAAVLMATGLGVQPADAGKVPIPCTSEKIVKVADLPGIKGPRGQTVALGWLYTGCFSGRWVGYVGSSTSYLTWQDGMLPAVVAQARVKMPNEPGFWFGATSAPGAFLAEWIWIVVLMLMTVAIIVQSQRNKAQAAPQAA
jgi:hypothetical protein